jgi:endonuclease III related protein
MPTLDDAFGSLCNALVERFGVGSDEFADLEPLEGMIAVLLERELGGRYRVALGALEEAGLVAVDRLSEASVIDIQAALGAKGIGPAPQAVAPLKNLARWLVDLHGGRVESLFDPHRSTEWLRGELASIGGVGPATAETIILFALKRPAYPVDRPTFRVLFRHGWLDPAASYEEVRDLLVDHAAGSGDVSDDEASALLINLKSNMAVLGREYCRAAGPRCEGCPIENLLPAGGPCDFDG